MAYQLSANTYNLNAFLTELGRTYLFGFDDKTKKQIRFDSDGQDLFSPKKFSVNDTDINYKSEEKLDANDLPILAGNRGVVGIKTMMNSKRKNFIVNSLGFNSNISFDSSMQEIKDISANTITIKVNVEQAFNNLNLGPISFRLFVVDSDTNYSNYQISGFSNQDEFAINKYGNTISLSGGEASYSTTLLITSASTLIEGSDNKITLGILPLSNCDTGVIPENEIKIIGNIPQKLGVGFIDSLISVENKQADGTLINYITLKLTDPEAKKQKVANINIKLPFFSSPLRTSPISISLLNSYVDGDNLLEIPILYSKDYISTLLERKQDIPLTFDVGTDSISFKIEKPYLNVKISATTQQLQSVINNLNNTINQDVLQIGIDNSKISSFNNTLIFINNDISNKQNSIDSLNVSLDGLNQQVINLSDDIIFQLTVAKNTTNNIGIKGNITSNIAVLRFNINHATTLQQRIDVVQNAITDSTYLTGKPSLQSQLNSIKTLKLDYENQINILNGEIAVLNSKKTDIQNQIDAANQDTIQINNNIILIRQQIIDTQTQLDLVIASESIILSISSLLSNNIYINTQSGSYDFCTYKVNL